MKRLLLVLVAFFCISGCAASENLPRAVVEVAGLTFEVEIAQTAASQKEGLSNETHLASGTGMLFTFASPRSPGFWMKDTLVPLDILWIRDSKVVGIETMPVCEGECPLFFPPSDVDMALEVPAGELRSVDVGDEVNVLYRS